MHFIEVFDYNKRTVLCRFAKLIGKVNLVLQNQILFLPSGDGIYFSNEKPQAKL